MKHEEQRAFIEAYDTNVCMYSKMEVERIVEGYFNGEDVTLMEGAEHVIDCLMIWISATVYQMKKLIALMILSFIGLNASALCLAPISGSNMEYYACKQAEAMQDQADAMQRMQMQQSQEALMPPMPAIRSRCIRTQPYGIVQCF